MNQVALFNSCYQYQVKCRLIWSSSNLHIITIKQKQIDEYKPPHPHPPKKTPKTKKKTWNIVGMRDPVLEIAL